MILLKKKSSHGWLNELDYLAIHTSLPPIRRRFAPGFVKYKKGALDSQPQVIKFTSCMPMVGGSLRVLRLLPPLKLVTMILLKVALNTKIKSNQIKSSIKGHCTIKRILLRAAYHVARWGQYSKKKTF